MMDGEQAPAIFDNDIFGAPQQEQEQNSAPSETPVPAERTKARPPSGDPFEEAPAKAVEREEPDLFQDPLLDNVEEIDLNEPSKAGQLLLDDSGDEQEQKPPSPKIVPEKPAIQPKPEIVPTVTTEIIAPPVTEEKEPITQEPTKPAVVSEPNPAELPTISPFGASGGKSVAERMKKSLDEEEDDSSLVVDHGLEIVVSEYEKRGDGMSAFVVYKVVVKVTNVPGFNKKEYTVWRRFSDFLGLHDKLSVKHLQSGRIVPPPPEKSVMGMTKTKMAKGTTEEDVGTNEYLEKRRAALERFLVRVSQHPILLQDPDFRDFVTMESELPKSTQTSAMSGAGVRRIISRVGDAISKMAYRMDETDRWFEEKQNEIEELDESLRKLHASVELLVHYRKELATSTDIFSKSMSMLAACEENTALSRAFSQLAETQEKVGLLQHDQADKDFYILSEMLKDYVAMLAAVKEVFYERVKVWQNWQTAQQNLTKRREVKTRLELAGKTDKLPAAKKDVQDGEQKVQELEEEFEKISKMIRKEMRRFDAQRIRDFKHTMLQYLESLSLTQQQSIKYWEAYLPEAKAIIS